MVCKLNILCKGYTPRAVRQLPLPNASNVKTLSSTSCLLDSLTILSQSSLHLLHSSSKSTNNLSYPLDLVKLSLELIDLLQYCSEACDFIIGHLDGIFRSVVLRLRCSFGCLVELIRARMNQSIVGQQHRMYPTAHSLTCSNRCEMACITRSKCRDSSCRLPGSSNSLP